MTSTMIKSITIAIVLATHGLLSSAKEVHHVADVGREDAGNSRGQRRMRTIKKVKNVRTKRGDNNLRSNKNNNKHDTVMDEEDVTFWTRLLIKGERGKGTDLPEGSLPFIPRPPTPPNRPPVQPPSGITSPEPTYYPTYSAITPNPTRRPTLRPTRRPTNKPTNKPTEARKCGISNSERSSQIRTQLSTVSSPSDFNTPGSPQQKALNWIINEDGAELCPNDSSLKQRYTLAVFYYSTNGDAWNKCSAPADFGNKNDIVAADTACTLTTSNATAIFPNDVRGTNAWLSPSSECFWGGISCYATKGANFMKVNVVEFEKNGLQGTLPSEMEVLDKIRFFALERESLTGPIPESYGSLKSLLLLDFDFNQLSGPLPASLWKLTNLRQLDLNNNQFSGTLSNDIGNLKQLRFFQIDNNNLVGGIPAGLGDVPNFSLIGLSGNGFAGAMPQSICDLRPSPLQTLVVDCNIQCSIPDCCTSCVP